MVNNTRVNKIEWLLVEDITCLKEHIARWQQLILETESNLFCSPEWIMTWIKIYWQPSWQLKTIIGFENKKLVAIAPLYIQPSKTLISISKLLPLGQGEPEESEVLSEFQDIVLLHNTESIYNELANKILSLTFDSLYCNTLLPNSNWHRILANFKKTTFTNTGQRYLITNNQDYLLTLSKNNKAKWKSCKNKLEKLNTEFIWVSESDYGKYWQQLILFHQQRWNKKGKLGAFFHDDFIKFHEIFQLSKSVKISVMLIDHKPIAINYYLTDHNTLFFYQCGWDEKDHANLSPGFSLHIWSILNNPFENYDFMSSDLNDSYKSTFASHKPEKIYRALFEKSKIKNILFTTIKKLLHKFK
ncbi:GNAT family N-acetyltransferase [Colwellia sp. BRX8-7]|uniref:GNAT family N-acetyltransferase n=1 Tax=Colwellia sp. BRX8-7 TaxID=2759833 RepID=UPI0015F3BDEC|nr:GNAT family N-acetyltransferase [Colwellia sp. BRX8-7]MBA6336428.1 GNAT family N-acetyltransferase [Colwellia sp. BRX8-7]